MSTRLTSVVLRREELPAHEVEDMYELFTQYFDIEGQDYFVRDLNQKEWIIQLIDSQTRRIAGFTSLVFYDFEHDKKQIKIVYSGDTIVAPEYWGTTELSRRWIHLVLDLNKNSKIPLFWLLLSGGYRTYRYLPVFFNEYYPRLEKPTSQAVKSIMDTVCTQLFNGAYHPEAGIVRPKHGATPLCREMAIIPVSRLRDPVVAYFIKQNPGFIQGDELVCLAEIKDENFTAAGRRMLGKSR